MKSKSNFALMVVLLQCMVVSTLFGQVATPDLPGTPGGKKMVAGSWTLLSDKDDLVFLGQRGVCNGHAQFWLKAENKSAREVHVFVSIQLDDRFRSPKQIVILQPRQTQEFTCTSQQSLIMIPIGEGTNPAVTLEYQVNKRL